MLHSRRLVREFDLLSLHEGSPERYPYLLQSVAHNNSQGRYDILFAFPGETLSSKECPGGFLTALDARWQAEFSREDSGQGIPFRGGWFVYLGYELAAEIEPSLKLPPAADGLPTAFATRIPAALIRDHLSGELILVAEDAELLTAMEADLAACADSTDVTPTVDAVVQEAEAERYLAGVRRVKDYIVEGDVFQVNLSRPWHATLNAPLSPAALYRRLCQHNPAPFAGLVLQDGAAIISSSPERLVRVSSEGMVETRPIAGTRRRDRDARRDQALLAELLAHPKERAEHIMLIDLERNDLGRIAVPGSVQVDELMVLESYAHVHHIVSNVRGQLRPGTTPGRVIRAVFPGGTITGCPKVRCMEIIAELEAEGRGAYTGSLGYLNRDGSMDLNILIRTLVQQGERLSLRAGAGIVADSDPQRELEETRAKARGLLLALGLTGQ